MLLALLAPALLALPDAALAAPPSTVNFDDLPAETKVVDQYNTPGRRIQFGHPNRFVAGSLPAGDPCPSPDNTGNLTVRDGGIAGRSASLLCRVTTGEFPSADFLTALHTDVARRGVSFRLRGLNLDDNAVTMKLYGPGNLLLGTRTITLANGQATVSVTRPGPDLVTVTLQAHHTAWPFYELVIDDIVMPLDDVPAPPPAPPPPPPPPPPPGSGPPPPAPQNVVKPEIRSAAGGSFTCDPGTWRNVASPSAFSYRWRIGQLLSVAVTKTYTPPPDYYGLPVYCQVTVAGPRGPVTATSPQVFFSSAGLNKLPPGYGDVRIRGIDVFQVVQPNAGARMFGYKPDLLFDPALCGGGTPTNWRGSGNRTPGFESTCRLSAGRIGAPDPDPQRVDYQGVTLDRYKKATAVVYVDVASAQPRDDKLAYDLELSATTGGGASLGEPVVKKVKDPARSDTPYVRAYERDDPKYGVQFRLPSAWTSRGEAIRLNARLRFPDDGYGTASYGTRQCDVPGCEANDDFALNGIPFADFPELLVQSLQLRRVGDGQGGLQNPNFVLSHARQLIPGLSRMTVSPYSADLDITAAAKLNATTDPKTGQPTCNGQTGPKVNTRECRIGAVGAIVTRWITDNPARFVRTPGGAYRADVYDVVMGVHDYTLPNGQREPGWERGIGEPDITSVSAREPQRSSDTPFFTATSSTRPLTAAAHELGHFLTAPHAGATWKCGTVAPNELWLPDDAGRLQGVKFDRSYLLGLWGLPTKTPPADPEVDGPYETELGGLSNPTLYDFMSYCAGSGDTETDPGVAWLSARNWNRFAYEMGQFGSRVGFGDRPQLVAPKGRSAAKAAAAGTGAGFAVGVAGPAGGQITSVVPPDGQDAVPHPDPASPFKLRSLGASGQVLLEAGVQVSPSSESGEGAGGPFAGPVAPGAVAVELVRGGTVLDRLERSRPPTVKLVAPKRGTRVRSRGKLEVRWAASDPDGGALSATVDFSPDNGKSWRTVYDGPSNGRATVAGSFLAGSRQARVRVSISDGFSEQTATSSAFPAEGTPPQVQILSPQAGALVRAGENTALSGSASDDLGRPLGGKALMWFAGRKRLGNGTRLSIRLPARRTMLKLVARDPNGRIGSASLPVAVEARRLRLVDAKVPVKVARRARTVNITITASAPSILTAAGRRVRVGRKPTKLTIRLPSKPAVGVVKIPFKLSAKDRTVKGTVSGAFSLVRT